MTGVKYGATESGVRAALVALGDTAEQVAKTLADGGYTGKPCASFACPVAEYLHDVTGREADVCAGSIQLLTGRTTAGDLDWLSVSDLPQGVADFIVSFDTGMFRELVRP